MTSGRRATAVRGLVLALLAVSGLVGARYFLGKLTDNIQTTSSVLDDDAVSGVSSAGKLPDGAMNMLLLGLDTRAGWEEKGELSRSELTEENIVRMGMHHD